MVKGDLARKDSLLRVPLTSREELGVGRRLDAILLARCAHLPTPSPPLQEGELWCAGLGPRMVQTVIVTPADAGMTLFCGR